MSRETMKPCKSCGSTCDGQFSAFCSTKCKTGQQAVEQLGTQLINLKPAPVKHIYFYDFAFGDLCDLFTTYLIKHLNASDLTKQRVVLRALERVERAITTKLDKWNPAPAIRKTIKDEIEALYHANMLIWRWKDEHFTHGPEYRLQTPTDEMWADYVDAYALRDAARRQLDRLVEGFTMTDKTYDQPRS